MVDATDTSIAKKSTAEARGDKPPERTTGRMHENVAASSDPVCSCEAEPYWLAALEEATDDLARAEAPKETEAPEKP